MLYALMGLGLSLITGVLNIPNFAHGALFAVGAYFLVSAVNVVGNFWIGLVLAPLGVAVLGLLIEYAGIRRLYAAGHAPDAAAVLLPALQAEVGDEARARPRRHHRHRRYAAAQGIRRLQGHRGLLVS